ncbi:MULTISPECIES: pitrilysin family protein [unclassified Janthinobacterium]|uniref:M16 family metallopeptidase n=1 Tax=unclassified Janthinobacterium TaxID=2610881 RepID=UPI001E4D3B37|nr:MULTISPECIES: insulinase family protein [unclassified Janthinobacterium]MCC7642541.1 insulinase family protein [Janthinobacterium sp. EB271-G4-3-1]MCC7692568.1 insulinase family protein [Janthinobacterium sp. EB271-G4-3-2]
MKLSKLRLISGAVLLACACMAQAEIRLSDPLPLAPEVTVGKLPNGLTYYIKKNARPAQKVELRLVVKAGSILEDDDQQGLAHFTEHMAFNGSTHFKRNELISYLQSIGVKFGADLNAYTSFDETVYVLPIPTNRKENLEKGFLVLEDWAHGLKFNPADINSERGIVLEEARLGKGASDRMNKVLYPKLLNGSRYAERMPIGKESVLKTFKPEAIKRFYKDWYRPDLMAVMVVGDVEPSQAEKLIRQHFGKLKNPAKPRPRLYAEVPQRSQTEALVITDKEAPDDSVFIRYPIRAAQEPVTIADYRRQMIENLYGQMLSARMQELTQQANPPFIQGGSSMGKLVRGYESFSAYALLGKGGVQPAVDALVQEDERARRFGFSQDELDRARKDMLRNYERAYSERDKSDSAGFVAEYSRNFLEQEAVPGIANELLYAQELLPQVTLQEINETVAKVIPDQQKKLVVFMGAEPKAGGAASTVPTQRQLLDAVAKAEQQKVEPRTEKVLASKLMDGPPAGGGIVSEKLNSAIGVTELTLGNGVRVLLKPTDFKNDQVLMGSTRFGGQSLFGDADIYNARYASAVVGSMGLKDLAPLDLQKVLAGKTVNVGASLGELSEGFGGSASSADVEAMLQLVYLYFNDVRKDAGLYQSFIGKQQDLAKNSMAQPEAVFYDAIQHAMFGDNPRVDGVPRAADFDKVGLDRSLDIFRQRFSSARGMTFIFAGSFELDKIKPLIASYLGTLPVGDVPHAYRDVGMRPVTGVVKKEIYMGSEPKSTISITFNGEVAYSDEQKLTLQALGEVLNLKVIEVLREKMSMIYGGGFETSMGQHPYGHYSVALNLPTGPENVDKVIAAAFAEINKMKTDGPSAADLEKVKLNWITRQQKSLRENRYWMSQLMGSVTQGRDPAHILRYEQRVRAITPQAVKLAAQRYLDMHNYVQVVMYPERKNVAVK